VPIFSCDLHIHSTLSPCGSLEMSSRGIVAKAKQVGLDIVAITDHNMAENCAYAVHVGKEEGLLVLAGMELQTAEELHLLSIFGDCETAMEMQRYVYDHLPAIENDPDYFGDQVVVDEHDVIVRFEERMLLNSSTLTLNEAVSWIRDHGGMVIPSHIDSPTFSIISQLGYVPDDVPFDALEVKRIEKVRDVLQFVMAKDTPLVTFSDAHYLKDIGKRRISLFMEEPGFTGVEKALKTFGNTARMFEGQV
jgi:3',5'-nucleoside bisphosphate phosphatase